MAVLGYLVTNFGFTVTYTRSDHAWHLRRGLFTTRETSMDANRLRGVSLGEPLGLRLAAGARLSAIVTGLNREEQGSSTLVPPAPRPVSLHVATAMLGTDEPLTTPLLDHGPAATRRRYTRALTVPVLLSVALVAAVVLRRPPGRLLAIAPVLLVAGAGLGYDRSRGLGHALLPAHLVARSGSLARRRVVLDSPAIIGWTISSTWFQRRVGLTSVVATMAGGHAVRDGARRPRGDGHRPRPRRGAGVGRAVPGLTRLRWLRARSASASLETTGRNVKSRRDAAR